MTTETILNDGRLVAYNQDRRYYVYNDCLYSVYIKEYYYNIWCDLDSLGKHLHRYYQVTGKRAFSDYADIVIVDREFFAQFYFA